MTKSCRQLDTDERMQISTLRYQNCSLPRITQILGRHRFTARREIQRNRPPHDGGYCSALVHKQAMGQHRHSRRNRQFSQAEMGRVETLLRQQWNPEQVVDYLRTQDELSISHETIHLMSRHPGQFCTITANNGTPSSTTTVRSKRRQARPSTSPRPTTPENEGRKRTPKG